MLLDTQHSASFYTSYKGPMFLTKIIRKIKQQKNELKFLILGLDNAGKTTILHKIFNKSLVVPPTFGYRVHNLNYKGVDLILCDIGGQAIFKTYWPNYYEKVDGVIFVFDSSDSRPFLTYLCDIMNDLVGVQVLIFSNKNDLNPNFTFESLGDEFMQFCTDNEVGLFVCSGITGLNLSEGLDWLVKRSCMALKSNIA